MRQQNHCHHIFKNSRTCNYGPRDSVPGRGINYFLAALQYPGVGSEDMQPVGLLDFVFCYCGYFMHKATTAVTLTLTYSTLCWVPLRELGWLSSGIALVP